MNEEVTPAQAPPPPLEALVPPPAAAPSGGWRTWGDRRVPLVVAGALLLAGCGVGAGVVAVSVAVSAAIVGPADDQSHVERSERGDGSDDGNHHDGEKQPGPAAPPTSTAVPSAPAKVVPLPSSS